MKKVPGHEAFQRMNFLYQIGSLASKQGCGILSAYYGNLMINIAKKSVLKIHPEVKRNICKRCRCVLVNNKTLHTKKSSNKQFVNIRRKCLQCKETKTYPTNKKKDNRIWVEKKEAIVEVIEYTKSAKGDNMGSSIS